MKDPPDTSHEDQDHGYDHQPSVLTQFSAATARVAPLAITTTLVGECVNDGWSRILDGLGDEISRH